MDVIYLDNNATTKVAPEVIDAMLPFLSENYGNPSSMHSFGGDVAASIKQARENVAKLIGAAADEIVFTSCGTESDSTAIRAAIESNPTKKHIVTTRVEHPAIKSLYETLSKNGYRVTWVPVDGQGRLDLEYLYDSLSEDTAVVSQGFQRFVGMGAGLIDHGTDARVGAGDGCAGYFDGGLQGRCGRMPGINQNAQLVHAGHG